MDEDWPRPLRFEVVPPSQTLRALLRASVRERGDSPLRLSSRALDALRFSSACWPLRWARLRLRVMKENGMNELSTVPRRARTIASFAASTGAGLNPAHHAGDVGVEGIV